MNEVNKTVYDSLTEKERIAVDTFFACIPSVSTEMVTTWLGKSPESGGMVVMEYNILNRLVWKCIEIAKGITEPPQLL